MGDVSVDWIEISSIDSLNSRDRGEKGLPEGLEGKGGADSWTSSLSRAGGWGEGWTGWFSSLTSWAGLGFKSTIGSEASFGMASFLMAGGVGVHWIGRSSLYVVYILLKPKKDRIQNIKIDY